MDFSEALTMEVNGASL